jgi:hypothetical protein
MSEPEQYFILTVVIPVEDNFNTIVRLLKFISYEKQYKPVRDSVHLMEYKFGPLTEEGVNLYKNMFRDVFDKSPFKKLCTFTTAEIPQ